MTIEQKWVKEAEYYDIIIIFEYSVPDSTKRFKIIFKRAQKNF